MVGTLIDTGILDDDRLSASTPMLDAIAVLRLSTASRSTSKPIRRMPGQPLGSSVPATTSLLAPPGCSGAVSYS